MFNKNTNTSSIHVLSHVSKISLAPSIDRFTTPSTEQNGDATDLNIVKIKEPDFNKLRTAFPSEFANSKPPIAVTALSTALCAKVTVTAAKTIDVSASSS